MTRSHSRARSRLSTRSLNGRNSILHERGVLRDRLAIGLCQANGLSLELRCVGLLHFLHDPFPPVERVHPKLSSFHNFGAGSEYMKARYTEQHRWRSSLKGISCICSSPSIRLNQQECAETRSFPPRGTEPRIAREQIGPSRREANSLPVGLLFGILLGRIGRNSSAIGKTQTQGRSNAQSPASRAHLVERPGRLCALHTRSVGAAGSAGRRSRLAAGGLLLCLPGRVEA